MHIVATLCFAGAVAGFSALTTLPASAQDAKEAEKPAAVAAGANKPSPAKMLTLIKTSIIALNQANQANDYSVLYKTAAPGFQKANPEAKLAETFAKFREAKLDLSPIVNFQPKVKQPELTEQGYLRLTGYFPTKPLQVNFDLLYENVQGDWKLYGIALAPVKAQAAGTQSAPPASQQKK